MPDNVDYEWLGQLLANPGHWTEDEHATAQQMLENQRRALADAHPRDREGASRSSG